MTVPSKDLIQNWGRNKKLSRQAKVKRIQYHQTSFTTNVKGPYIVKKYKRRKKIYKINPKQVENAIGTYISIITLNVNELNVPTKRHTLAKWIQKQEPYVCCLQETHFRPQDTYKLKVRGWKTIFHANGKQKKAGVAVFISEKKIDLKIRKIKSDKEGYYIMITGSIQEEDMLCYAKSFQSCLTLCDRIDGSPPGSPVPGILQARTLEWVAISFSSAWKWKVKVKSLSRVWLLATPWTEAYQAPPSMGFSRKEYWSGVPSPSLRGRHNNFKYLCI